MCRLSGNILHPASMMFRKMIQVGKESLCTSGMFGREPYGINNHCRVSGISGEVFQAQAGLKEWVVEWCGNLCFKEYDQWPGVCCWTSFRMTLTIVATTWWNSKVCFSKWIERCASDVICRTTLNQHIANFLAFLFGKWNPQRSADMGTFGVERNSVLKEFHLVNEEEDKKLILVFPRKEVGIVCGWSLPYLELMFQTRQLKFWLVVYLFWFQYLNEIVNSGWNLFWFLSNNRLNKNNQLITH